MYIGDLRRLGGAGIDDDEQLVGILGDAPELSRRLGDLVTLHTVPADGQEEVRFRRIDRGMKVLAPHGTPAYPEDAGKLLG